MAAHGTRNLLSGVTVLGATLVDILVATRDGCGGVQNR